MHACIFNHWVTYLLDSMHHLILRLPVWPYLGLVSEVAPPTVILHRTSGAAWFYLLVFFNNVYSKNLGFLVKTWGLWSVLEGSPFDFWCPTFSGVGSEVADELSFTVPSARAADFFFRLIQKSYRLSLLLFPGCSFLRSCLAGVFGILLALKGSLFSQGPKILGGTSPHLRSDILGILLHALLFFNPVTKKFSWDLLPVLQQDWFFGFIFSSFCRVREN